MGLTAGQAIKQLMPYALAASMFALQAMLEGLPIIASDC
jgi:hypothetical protein